MECVLFCILTAPNDAFANLNNAVVDSRIIFECKVCVNKIIVHKI